MVDVKTLKFWEEKISVEHKSITELRFARSIGAMSITYLPTTIIDP